MKLRYSMRIHFITTCNPFIPTEPPKGHREKKLSSAHEKPSSAHEMVSRAQYIYFFLAMSLRGLRIFQYLYKNVKNNE